MADLNDDLLDGDEDDASGDDAGTDDTSTDQQGVTLEALQAKIDSLESANTKTARDLIAAVGRLQAMQAKLDEAPSDSATVTALRTQMAAANEVLDALLEDEAVDPKVKAKATAARTKAQTSAEAERIAALEARIEALTNPKAPPAAISAGNTSFEDGVVTAIEAAGLDPDDPIFDWKGEASQLLNTQGPAAARDYFKKQIAAGLEAKAAATRRQTRKEAGSTQTRAAGDATNPLDSSRPLEERMKHLKAIGAI